MPHTLDTLTLTARGRGATQRNVAKKHNVLNDSRDDDQSSGYRWTVVSTPSIGSCSSYGPVSVATAVATGAKRGGRCRCEDMEGSKQADIELEYMRGSAFCSGPGSLTAIADDKMDVIDNDKLKDTKRYPSRERRESLRSSWAQVTETEVWACGYFYGLPLHTHGGKQKHTEHQICGSLDDVLGSTTCVSSAAGASTHAQSAALLTTTRPQFLLCSGGVAAALLQRRKRGQLLIRPRDAEQREKQAVLRDVEGASSSVVSQRSTAEGVCVTMLLSGEGTP